MVRTAGGNRFNVWAFCILTLTILSLLFFSANAQPNKLNIHFVNVGQGNAVLVEFPNDRVLLYDGGPSDAGSTLVKYIRDRGVNHLDAVIASHADTDHIGGLIDVINTFSVGTVYDAGYPHTTKTYHNFLTAIEESNATFDTPREGDTINLGPEAVVTFLYPRELGPGTNGSTLVAQIDYRDFRVLLTGDAGVEQESAMLSWGVSDQVDVLQVGHHGSNTSTSQAFLDVIKPSVAVIPVGAGNSYGHPHQEVVHRLRMNGVTVYRTDRNGTVIVASDGRNYKVRTEQAVAAPVQRNSRPDKPRAAGIQIVGIDKVEEVVTLVNTGDEKVDLSGWTLVSVLGDQTFTFPKRFWLNAQGTVQVVSGRGAMSDPPTQLKWMGSYVWNNDEHDPGILYNADGEVVSQWP